MRQRGAFTTAGWEDLVHKFLNKSLSAEFAAPWTVHTRRPRKAPIRFTAEQIDTAKRQVATALAQQNVANGLASDVAAETQRILDQMGLTSPNQDERHTPKTKPSVKKPLKRQRRSKLAKPKSTRPKTADEWLQQAARVLTQRRIKNGEHIVFNDAYIASLAELRNGFFNPKHWKECEVLQTDYLQSVPTSTNDPKNRSYRYSDPANKRSLAVYHNGTPADGPPRYSGSTIDFQFRDVLLVWQRTTYKLVNEIEDDAVEPTFIEIKGEIRAYADRRGSRPMLSYICKTWLTAEGSSYLTTDTPPTAKPWSFYYRYHLPPQQPPFYQQFDAKHVIRTMRQKNHQEAGVTLSHAVVLLAPRPMYGRGFNNNKSVTTQLLAGAKLWQIDLNQPDPEWNHIQMYTIPGTCTTDYPSRVNGIYLEQQAVVKCWPMTPFGVEMVLANNPLNPPEMRAEAIAKCQALLGDSRGFVYTNPSKHMREGFEYTSPWTHDGADAIYADLQAHDADVRHGLSMFGFIWNPGTRSAFMCSLYDFTVDESGSYIIVPTTLDGFKAPRTTLYINGAQYWVSPE